MNTGKRGITLKKPIRILICLACCALLSLAWVFAVNSKSLSEKQLVLMNTAAALINDGIYIRAVPLLEEAAGYDAKHTIDAENELKKVYLRLIETRGFPRRYIALLEKQMNRRDAPSGVFIEAAEYYISISKTQEALTVLRNGIEKTPDVALVTLYENSRYVFETSRTSYESVTAIYGQTAQVRHEGKWGIANSDGTVLIPCRYEMISTFYGDRAIVNNGGLI